MVGAGQSRPQLKRPARFSRLGGGQSSKNLGSVQGVPAIRARSLSKPFGIMISLRSEKLGIISRKSERELNRIPCVLRTREFCDLAALEG